MPPPYERGHVRAPNKDHLIHLSLLRQGRRLRALSQLAPPPEWDSVAKNWIGAVKDQAQCGSCWDFSGTGVVEVAYAVAGMGPVVLSEEYTLSCGKNGGCNGDDNVTVLEWAKATGLPLSSDYGPYTQRPGTCNFRSGMKLYKIDEWGFADQSGGNGVTPTAMIQQAIMTYGCVGCAVAAGSSWDGYSGGEHWGNSHNIDHDVILVGWKQSTQKPGKVVWKMRNSWSPSWGDQGYMWIGEGADDIGTEAVFALVKNPNPPVPLDPDLWD